MRTLAICLLCLAPLACAQSATDATTYDTSDGGSGGEDGSTTNDGASHEAAGDTSGMDSASTQDAPGADTATDGPPPIDSGTSAIKYECPVHLSQGCADGSQCESTCLGQFQDTAT